MKLLQYPQQLENALRAALTAVHCSGDYETARKALHEVNTIFALETRAVLQGVKNEPN